VEQRIRSLLRRLAQDHTPGGYLLGLLLGLGVIVYMLYSIKRGYLIGYREGFLPNSSRRETITYLSRKQEPLSFWTGVIVCLLIGGLVVVVCVSTLWEWGKAW
jgi:hypothetical protein